MKKIESEFCDAENPESERLTDEWTQNLSFWLMKKLESELDSEPKLFTDG